MADAPISPKILDAFADAGKDLSSGTVKLGDALGSDSRLVESSKQLFRQIIDAELGVSIAAFSQDEKEEAIEALEDAQDDSLGPLIEVFEAFCDSWPDVLDVTYGGTRVDFREFRSSVVPELLEALHYWARAHEYVDLVQPLEEAQHAFTTGIRRAGGRVDAD